VDRIEKNYGVTVQGPPGTGKTHTIANLVSHFLAEGKRVLITSQKESPLRVLKSKIPKDIQDLCVPVLGGGSDSLQEIEKSINTISEKLGELDTAKLSSIIELNLKYFDESKRKESEIVNQLKEYTEKEGSVLKYKEEEFFRYDIAKKLSETDINYEWLLDDLEIKAEFPINEVDFKELWRLRDMLNIDDLKLYSTILPKIDTDIRNEKSFKDFVQEGSELAETKDEGSKQLETYRLSNDISSLDGIIQILNTILDLKHITQNDGYQSILTDLRAGGIRRERWLKLVNDMQDSCNQLFYYYNKLVTHTIHVPDKDISEVKEDLKVAKERIESGKKPNLAFFLFKGKRTKYLFEESILNDQPLSRLENFEPIEDEINYQELKVETARIFNGNMQEINHTTIDQDKTRFPHLLEERLEELKTVIKVFELMNSLENKLIISDVDLYSVDEVDTVLKNIKLAKVYLEYEK